MIEGKERVDFHVHYDPLVPGSALNIVDLASKAKVVGLGLLARGEVSTNFGPVVRYAEKQGIRVFPGIEILTKIGDTKDHAELIGLGFDPNNRDIIQNFGIEKQKQRNKKVAELQKKFLESYGFTFEGMLHEDSVLFAKIMDGETFEKAIHLCRFVTQIPSNRSKVAELKQLEMDSWNEIKASCSKKNGYKGHPSRLEAKFLYENIFAIDKPGNIFVQNAIGSDLAKLSSQVIDIIHKAGGCVLYSPEGKFSQNIWDTLQDENIDGMMVFHADRLGYDNDQLDVPLEVIKNAREKGMLTLGGSDYQNKDWKLGMGRGNMFISPRRLNELTERLQKVRASLVQSSL